MLGDTAEVSRLSLMVETIEEDDDDDDCGMRLDNSESIVEEVCDNDNGDEDASMSLPKCKLPWAEDTTVLVLLVLVPVAAVVLVINFFNLRAIVVLCH